MKLIPAPDFPTGGLIISTDGIKDLYNTGHGSIVVRAKATIEAPVQVKGKGGKIRTKIVFTELPYGVNKAGEDIYLLMMIVLE